MSGRVLGLDHLGVAAKDPKPRLQFWADLLGLPLEKAEVVPTEGVRTWFLDLGAGHLELLEPMNEDSAVAKHIEKRGEGLHHLSLLVDDLGAVLARLSARGVEPLAPGVRPGAGGAKVAFFHPRDTGGVLLELSERLRRERGAEAEVAAAAAPFTRGAPVVLHLRDPRQRVFGVLRQLDGVGAAVYGIDVDSWEGWVGQSRRGEEGPLTPSLEYFPIARVEKIVADSDSADLPSFERRFSERTGRSLREVLGATTEGSPE